MNLGVVDVSLLAAGDALAEVAVALPVARTYHYRVPAGLRHEVKVGSHVVVDFAKRRASGVVVRYPAVLPDAVAGDAALQLADLRQVVRDTPAVSEELVNLCLWVAEYYEAPPGEALRAALPVGAAGAAAVWVELTDEGKQWMAGEGGALGPGARAALVALAQRSRTRASQLSSQGRKELPQLLAQGLVRHHEAAGRHRGRTEKVARLAAGVTPAALQQACARAPRRWAVAQLLIAGDKAVTELRGVDPGAASQLRALVAAGLVVTEIRDVDALVPPSSLPAALVAPELSAEQKVAHAALSTALGAGFSAALIHGVTGSGKTEVYLHVIADALAAGRSAIVLVPEISLTPQLAARFSARFGAQVAVLHSGLSPAQRLSEWRRLAEGRARIALGARSAVFAPVANLGVIVVDEEHDSSFKQEEGVRYHARDVALVRAQRAGAVCILGSATPSLESYHATRQARMRLLEITERPTASPLPEVEVVDLRVHAPDGESMLSAPLARAVQENLAAGDQTVLFLNRRGFATFVLCVACGHSFGCPNCSVSLTYHLRQDRLLCHYCGHAQGIPERCPQCKGHGTIERKGLGTERVAAALAEVVPEARIARLDRDVAAGAEVERILTRVARREVDILVGTQMVTKGHDFPGVTLVGVLCADTGLSLPDFRASERTFQLLSQVAGRAGRGERPGRVLIQTYRAQAEAVACAQRHDYRGFFDAECVTRKELGYPPFGRLVAVRIDGPDAHKVAQAAATLAALAVRLGLGEEVEVLGPVPSPLSRLRGRVRWQLWLRGPERGPLRRVMRALRTAEVPSSVRVGIDVDPITAL
jgi:primosomal protein N' (replication factor Y)